MNAMTDDLATLRLLEQLIARRSVTPTTPAARPW